jgi:hypothetical protein
MVNGISPALYGLDATSWSATQARRESSTATNLLAVQASSDTTAEIDIATKDGDTVTISLSSDVDAGYAYYRRTGPAAGSELEARAIVASASRELQITVQGSLDEQELADIAKLVQQLGQAIRSFVRGDTTASARQALDVKALDSLSGFSLDMAHSDSLTLVAASAATQTGPVGTVVFEKPAAQPAPVLPSAGDAAATISPDSPHGEVHGVLDAMRKSVEDSGIDLARAGSLLVKALQRLLRNIAEEPGSEPARPALEEISARFPQHLHRSDD